MRERTGMIGHIVLVDARARGGAGTLQKVEILEQKRHAGEGTVGKALVDLPPCIVVMLDDDGIDLRIDLGGARDGLVQQFAGTDLLLADEVGKADGVVLAIFRECHLSPCNARRDANLDASCRELSGGNGCKRSRSNQPSTS